MYAPTASAPCTVTTPAGETTTSVEYVDDVSVKVTGPPSEPDVAIVVVYVGELVVATVPVVVAALSVPLVTKSV